MNARQLRLLNAVRTYGGQWTTARARALYTVTDPGASQRGTARRDLALLHRAGHLALVDTPNNKHYIPTWKDMP
ncbi:hypothetical protein ABZX85_23105 [Streptomyces sp. NPDC004539]|uniref:hypothetical protein n=1 Tax=Streptomyces sp. NPDC004539 TaxID=3154280 RepID=UPI0033A4F6A0